MSKRTVLTILAIFLAAVLVGCSKEEAPAPAPSQPAATTTAPPVDMANAATITGKVSYKDGKPKRPPINMGADAACKAMHKEPPLSEAKVINDNGTVRWATVYVKDGLGGRSFPAPAQAVELDQEGCVYKPHVVAVMTNQTINISNSDQTTHNIHPVPKINREWNESQPPGAGTLTKAFAREELAIPVKCNIHPWMHSYIHVFSHPFFSVTGEDGSFTIKGLPPGEYTIAVWTESLGTQEQKVTVAAKETKTVDFTVTGK
ncbi:MAG TPA: carboxypeptidase regulatory-like domain-containing protein [Candidatus Xenobia bacterium]|nr:carboxypeptidase regulatory-like domain-containing protein [Candidatus Xenobia bacterium]